MLQKKEKKNTLNSEPQRTIRVSHVRRTPGATTTRGNMQTANRKQNSSREKSKQKASSVGEINLLTVIQVGLN